MIVLRRYPSALAALVFLTAMTHGALSCRPVEIEDNRRLLLASWGDHVILPLYRDFETAAGTLDDAARSLCASPSTQSLEAAQTAWRGARAPWKQAEVFAFGPYKDEPLRLGPKVDFWPVRIDSITEVLDGTDVLTPEFVATLGAAQSGLPVIEYLLYQPGSDLVAEFTSNPRRCDYLLGLTADLLGHAGEMVAAWDPARGDYLAELLEAGRGSTTYSSLSMAVGEIASRMAFTVENIRADKLGRPAGTSSGGSPQPDKAESQPSGRSLDDIRNNLQTIEILYHGDEASGQLGLDFYLKKRGYHFAARMHDRLAAARLAVDAIPPPLTEAVVTSPATVLAAIDELGNLQRLIQVDIINALSLTVGFNDNDGD